MTKPLDPEEKKQRALHSQEVRAVARAAYRARQKEIKSLPETKRKAAARAKEWRARLRSEQPELYQQRLEENSRRGKASYETGRERYVDKGLLWRFGITLEEARALLIQQSSRCPICLCQLPDFLEAERRTCVDHCHATGKVRGILCNKCNLGLGHLQDDVERLERGIKYLSR